MPPSRCLQVMVSSRCATPFPGAADGTRMADVRRRLKAHLESLHLAGERLFDVWINEDEAAQDPSETTWGRSLKQARDCDLLLALYTGDAGWSQDRGGIGVCHAELQAALEDAPTKVRILSLGRRPGDFGALEGLGAAFDAYLTGQQLWHAVVPTPEALCAEAERAVRDAVVQVYRAGIREGRRGKTRFGAVLDWRRLNFDRRRQAMVRALRAALCDVLDGTPCGHECVRARLDDTDLLLVVDAIPDAFSVAPARELVGQPFLRDHEHARLVDEGGAEFVGGPVHVIACYQGATEAQARRFLGVADATIVTGAFGVFVADAVQKVQFAFLSRCRDEASTRVAAQELFEWLRQSDEERRFVARARSRARIVRAIRDEMEAPPPP